MYKNFFILLPLLICPNLAFAYIGPGLGVGAIAAIIGIFVAICVTVFSIIYFPVKKVIRKLKERQNDQQKKSK